ncbi:MAG TPA: Fur family transcriptional regulator [Candidatus Omnitrophota bacterium]|nr:Fur family transcriptional regulator [Candidatus Omnitrophota bacterium]
MTFPPAHHDHGHCVAHALEAAEAECRRRGARLTEVRRRVLELVWQSHQPVGAYAVLEALGREGFCAAPPTVYRALDFLLAHGLVHRIERLNAFVGCSHLGAPHAARFLLCSRCGAAAELDDPAIDGAVAAAAARLGFSIGRQTVEIEGVCPACQSGGQA